ncbi:hypothetical protein NDU88_008957 [Pleurodeles waltl]|uniref:Retrotransposon gag domain-containing protein n=1 Tax=Pleurodeles waltl TaxID=8319 RepID=A0AAV7N9Y2_PLEWA|nr:hypothetical protein NDU88_008957 [Pleurodeles waltl]
MDEVRSGTDKMGQGQVVGGNRLRLKLKEPGTVNEMLAQPRHPSRWFSSCRWNTMRTKRKLKKIAKSVEEEEPRFSCTTLKNALTAHFNPFANPEYERFLLRQVRQQPEEYVDAFYARL